MGQNHRQCKDNLAAPGRSLRSGSRPVFPGSGVGRLSRRDYGNPAKRGLSSPGKQLITGYRQIKKFSRYLLNGTMALPGLHQLARLSARAGFLPQRVWCGFPLDEIMDLQIHDAQFRYDVRTGDYVGMPLYWLGAKGYEWETLTLLAGLFKKANRFYDVGANTGLFSLFAAALNPTLKIHAFEPSPETARQLQRNIDLNEFQKRVLVAGVAISDEIGETDFFVPDALFATSAGLASYGGTILDEKKITVAVETLDNYSEKAGDPDLIKIDIEGFEDKALAGMKDLLARHRPALILEVLEDGPAEKIEQLLLPFGYRFGLITATGPQWHNQLQGQASATYRNWLCISPESPIQI